MHKNISITKTIEKVMMSTDLDNLCPIFQIGTLLRSLQNFDNLSIRIDDNSPVNNSFVQKHGSAPEGFQLSRHREVFPDETISRTSCRKLASER